MARRQPHNQAPEPIDWGAFMPQPAPGEQAVATDSMDAIETPPTSQTGGLAITPEAYALLQLHDQRRIEAAAAQREALVRFHQEKLRQTQQQIAQPMFGGARGLPMYPRNDLQLPPGVAGRQPPALPASPHQAGGRPLLPPAPGKNGNEQAGRGQDARKNGARKNSSDPNKKSFSAKEWFNGLSPTRKASVGLTAGVVAVAGIVGIGKMPVEPGTTSAQIAKANQEYPVFKNDGMSCGVALAKVAFAGSMTLDLKVNLKEPGHTAYIPVAAYMGTDLSVATCGEPGKDGSAQPLATYNGKQYVADRSVLALNAPSNAFAAQTCADPNAVKRICIKTPKGFFVDGKKATIAGKEMQKGSGLFQVTTEDNKKFTVTAAELSRINKLTSPPAKGAQPSKEYTQYLTAIATNMKFTALNTLENPANCKPLQDSIDAAVDKAIIARNKTLNFKEPKKATTFKASTKYAAMSTDFMNDKANKAILDPKNPAHIITAENFQPDCSATAIDGGAATGTQATKTANK